MARSVHNNRALHSLAVSTFRGLQRIGISVTPNHFYWPIPDIAELERRDWPANSPLVGIDLRIDEQVDLALELAARHGSEWNFLEHPEGSLAYHYNNGFFETVDAEIAYSLVRKFKPQRIIEVGGGHSTRVLAAALQANFLAGNKGELVTIDPHCDALVEQGLAGVSTLIAKPVQEVELDLFLSLQENDILFLDSSHVVSIGSDAVCEYLEIVPRLKKGVVVHAHDIFLPSDYPREPVLKSLCFWSEQYLLQSFLSFNPNFEVVWGSSAMQNFHPEVLEQVFPRWSQSYSSMPKDRRRFVPTLDGRRVWPSSFWMRRVA
jgi:predicted O-methyltransferase YrrM